MGTLSILAISAVVLGFVLHKYTNRIPEVDLPRKTIKLPCVILKGDILDVERYYRHRDRDIEYIEFILDQIVYAILAEQRAPHFWDSGVTYSDVSIIRYINGVSYLVLMSHPDLLKLIYSKANT